MSCIEETPGILTETQINSISESMSQIKSRIAELQTVGLLACF